MSTKLTYTGAEVQELLDKIGKGDFDNAKTLEGHPASYFAVASEFTSLAASFATEQGRINTLCSYFNNGSANDALSLGGQLPSYYATATQYEILQQTLADFKSLFDSMFEKDSDGNIHAKLSLWSSGGITAGGVGSGGSGGGGISYNRLDSWADYSADKSGWVLSALLGKDLDDRVSALANAGYITASYLAPYALRSELPIITKDGLKSTLGISDWALAATKPTYTASEVGALGVNDTATNANKLGGYLPTTYMRASGPYADSLNDLTSLGIYRMSGPIKDGPTGAGWHGNLMVVRSNRLDTLSQLYFNSNNNHIFVRSGTNSNFTSKDWSTLAFTSDIPTKLSQLADDVVAGKYLPLSGGQMVGELAIKGGAGKVATIRFMPNDGAINHWLGVDTIGELWFTNNGWSRQWVILHSGNYSNLLAGGTINGSLTATSFIGNLTGTADKASTQAVRYSNRDVNLWDIGDSIVRYFALGDTAQNTPSGVYTLGSILMEYSWDTNAGFQMISNNAGNTLLYRSRWNGAFKDWREIAFTDSNVASATKLQTPRTIWGQSFDGTQDITGALTAPSITANSLTIGGATITYDSVNEALCVNGNMYALGGITAGAAGISAYTSLEARVARIEQQLNIS